MIKPNIGTWDAYVRIMLGLTALAFGIRRSSRKDDLMGALMILTGSMKVAEGITRICPLMYAMGIRTTDQATDKMQSPIQTGSPVASSPSPGSQPSDQRQQDQTAS
jgi:Protein of unknown function (DUF2892)